MTTEPQESFFDRILEVLFFVALILRCFMKVPGALRLNHFLKKSCLSADIDLTTSTSLATSKY